MTDLNIWAQRLNKTHCVKMSEQRYVMSETKEKDLFVSQITGKMVKNRMANQDAVQRPPSPSAPKSKDQLLNPTVTQTVPVSRRNSSSMMKALASHVNSMMGLNKSNN